MHVGIEKHLVAQSDETHMFCVNFVQATRTFICFSSVSKILFLNLHNDSLSLYSIEKRNMLSFQKWNEGALMLTILFIIFEFISFFIF